jgi:hypothetical protein
MLVWYIIHAMTERQRIPLHLALLLTSAIDPGNVPKTRRIDPKKREADYIGVIDRLKGLACLSYTTVIFAESTKWNLTEVKRRLASLASRSVVHQRLQSSDMNHRGKGYFEMETLKSVFDEVSQVISHADYVIKLSGRYFPENFDALIEPLSSGDVYVLSDFNGSNAWTYSGFFVARPDFYTRYLLPSLGSIDERAGIFFEQVLHDAIVQARNDGHEVLSFSEKPVIVGVSGTWDVPIDKNNYRSIAFSLPKMVIISKAYAKAALRRLRVFFRNFFRSKIEGK